MGEKMGDYISRRAAIKAIDDLPNCYNGYSDTYDKAYIIGVLEELPRVDVPDRKVGEWITEHDSWGGLFKTVRAHKCSICGNYLDFDGVNAGRGDANYCPNCGAKMSGDIKDGE